MDERELAGTPVKKASRKGDKTGALTVKVISILMILGTWLAFGVGYKN